MNSKNVEEIIIPPEKGKYYKVGHYKTSKSLSDLTVSKFVKKKIDQSK